jgi:D-alanyl-D-alanine-carboxypeptidase/D-alanyl-D-alanine-endopeptidase
MPSNTRDKAIVAENLRYQRKRKGLTQELLSESSGVAIRTIQRIENAQVEPHRQTLALLAEALELDVHELSCLAPAGGSEQGTTAEGKWLILLHLTPALGLIIPFANLILPLIIWAFKRGEHPLYDLYGRAVINFHLTVTFVFMAGVALLFVLFHIGLLLLILASACALSFIIWNTWSVMKSRHYNYPFSVKLL